MLRPSHRKELERCYVSNNNFLKFYPLDISDNSIAQNLNNSTYYGFEASLCGKEGYSSIVYSTSTEPKYVYAKYIFFDQFILNATDMTISPFEQESFSRGNWKLRQFYYKKSSNYFKSLLNSTITFECNKSKKPYFNKTSNIWVIPKPDETTTIHGFDSKK